MTAALDRHDTRFDQVQAALGDQGRLLHAILERLDARS